MLISIGKRVRRPISHDRKSRKTEDVFAAEGKLPERSKQQLQEL